MSEAHFPRPEEEQAPSGPRAYFASLADYNQMVLHGVWIDDLTDPDQVHAEILKMLAASEAAVAEEWVVHDYEGLGDWSPPEYESIENLSRVAAGIEKHGLAFSAWVSYLGDPTDERLDQFDEAFRGSWRSMAEFAEDTVEDCGIDIHEHIPSWLQPYVNVDFDALGRDMSVDLHAMPDGSGGLWVFDPNV